MFAALVLSLSMTFPVAATPVEYKIPSSQEEFDAGWEVVPGDEGTGLWTWVAGAGGAIAHAEMSMIADGAVGPTLLLSTPIEMKAGETFYVQANVTTDNWNNDAYFYIVYGTDKGNLVSMPVDDNQFKCWGSSYSYKPADSSDFRKLSITVDGNYYIGIRPRKGSNDKGFPFMCSGFKVEKMVNYPQNVTSLEAKAAEDGSLSATLKWTWPTKNLDGTNIEGSVSANIYRSISNMPADIYKNECLIGTVTDGIPGETASFVDGENSLIPITEAGKYYYYVAPFTAAGENSDCVSSRIKEVEWIGEDAEVRNPTHFNVKLVDGEVHLEWEEHKEGKNGGWIDPEEFFYRIYRSKDGGEYVLICDNYKAAPPYIDNTGFDGLGLYTYQVKAVYKGNESIAAPTAFNGDNKVYTGGTAELPFSEDFSTAESMSMFTVVTDYSSNKWTRQTYGSNVGSVKFNANYYNTTSILITPPFSLEAGKTYKISCKSWVDEEEIDDWYDSYYEAVPHDLYFTAGAEATIDGQAQIGSKYIDQASDKKMTAEAYFSPESDGTYYFGLKASFKDSYGIFIDDLLIEESVTIPATVADLSAVPAADGANAAEIAFTVPDKSNGGQDLESVSKVEITRKAYDGDEETSEIVKTLTGDGCTPGKAVSFTDELAARGYYSYSVVSYSGDSASEAAASEKVWYGFDDPKPVSGMLISVNIKDNGDPAISWTGLTISETSKGSVHNGYLTPETLKYNVYRLDITKADAEPELLGQSSETSFTDTEVADAVWSSYRYGVAAVNKDIVNNVEYESTINYEYPTHILGDVIELPYEPDFTDENTAKIWHTSTCRLDGGIIFSDRGETEGKDYMAYTPPFRTEASQNLGCSLDLTFSRGDAEVEEAFEVYLCSLDAAAPTPEDQPVKNKALVIPGADTRSLVKTVPVTALHDTPESTTVKFDLPAAGRYRVAFRCSSPDNKDLKIHSLVMKNDIVTGIETVKAEQLDEDVEIYTLQGVRVSGDNLESGIYILRSKTSVKKVLIK